MSAALYAALATSASVFIGILGALLASNVTNREAERSRINRRLETIAARDESLRDKQQSLERDIEEHREEQGAAETDDSDHSIPFYTPVGGYEEHEPISTPVQDHMNLTEELHDERQDTMNRWRLLQVETEREALKREKERLEDQYDALDPARAMTGFVVGVFAIFMSVAIPMIALVATVTGWPTIPIDPPGGDPGAVFGSWFVGLIAVFIYLGWRIGVSSEDLPEDLGIDGTNAEGASDAIANEETDTDYEEATE